MVFACLVQWLQYNVVSMCACTDTNMIHHEMLHFKGACLHICIYCSIAYGHGVCISHQSYSWADVKFKACFKLDLRKWKDVSGEKKKVCTPEQMYMLSTMIAIKAQRRWRLSWTTQMRSRSTYSRDFKDSFGQNQKTRKLSSWQVLTQDKLCYVRRCFGYPHMNELDIYPSGLWLK